MPGYRLLSGVMPADYYIYVLVDPRTLEPFYVGKGCGDRVFDHFLPYRRNRGRYHKRIAEIMSTGVETLIWIPYQGLLEPVALDIEKRFTDYCGTFLLNYVPGGAYTGLKPVKRAWTCWDEAFRSLKAVVGDPRCVNSLRVVKHRLHLSWNLQVACETPSRVNPKLQVTCWGEVFPSLIAVIRDSRCRCAGRTLTERLRAGLPLQEAVDTPPCSGKSYRTGWKLICWGEPFSSYRALAKDSRCKVGYSTLLKRASGGGTLESACETSMLKLRPRVPKKSKNTRPPVICWGESFSSYSVLCKDSRCTATSGQLIKKRVEAGYLIEEAVKKKLDQWVRVQVILARRGIIFSRQN